MTFGCSKSRKSNEPQIAKVKTAEKVNLGHREIETHSFRRIIENKTFNKTLRLTDDDHSHTLVRNCRFFRIDGDGVLLRDVCNVTIADCIFDNINGQAAIRGSVAGGTQDVRILGNSIRNCAENGITFGQRSHLGVDHRRLLIEGNQIVDTGQSRGDGKSHSIYVQARDFEIIGNVISGARDGNAISVRSSGKVLGNRITGESKTRKPGIRYFSDHQRGASNELFISGNYISGQRIGIDLSEPMPRYDGKIGDGHVVQSFVLKGNDVEANQTPIAVSEELRQSAYRTVIE
ncbi:right-handed parallel beta-helix repeat-containing protein [Novipirellula herctigrandis]